MDINTKIHVVWGVYNNPMTPEDKKVKAEALLRQIVATLEPTKLTKKIEEALNA